MGWFCMRSERFCLYAYTFVFQKIVYISLIYLFISSLEVISRWLTCDKAFSKCFSSRNETNSWNKECVRSCLQRGLFLYRKYLKGRIKNHIKGGKSVFQKCNRGKVVYNNRVNLMPFI